MHNNMEMISVVEPSITSIDIHIRCADKKEASVLSDLTWRSKGYWGYDEEFLRDCGELLNVKSSYLERAIAFVAENGVGHIVGFYSLSIENDNDKQLLYLQVDPDYIGRGLGRLLWNHAIKQARNQGWLSFTIHAEPHAASFFHHMGAVNFKERPSRFRANRTIPILLYHL